jgi:hypothetical protein
MSYDLYFRMRNPSAPLTQERFEAYFASRPTYKVESRQAIYENGDTGVYFMFDYGNPFEGAESSEARNDDSLAPVAFNLNYYRPHVFGLEAEPEVRSLVEHFELSVVDPQNDGMSEGAYSTDGFLRGWNAGNAFAHRAFLSDPQHEQPRALPEDVIQRAWGWNIQREALQQELGESVFVPRIMFAADEPRVATTVVWGDGLPILLPAVDMVIAPRDQLAPRKLFGKRGDRVVFDWEELKPLAQSFQRRDGPLPSYELFYDSLPPQVDRLFRAARRVVGNLTLLRPDSVLDEELVKPGTRAS